MGMVIFSLQSATTGWISYRIIASFLSIISVMTVSSLTALSPLDGRYANKCTAIRPLLSEFGLIQHRLLVEIRWLQALSAQPEITEIPTLSPSAQQFLDSLIADFFPTRRRTH